MIITKEVKINNRKLKKHYEQLGYDVLLKYSLVKPTDLSKNSHVEIKVKCDICGLEKKLKYFQYIKNTNNLTEEYCCSKKCSNDKCIRRLNDKYNVENIFQLDKIKEKSKNTLLKKYGVDHPMHSNTIIKKLQNTNLSKYGKKYGLETEEVWDKIKITNLEKYGVEYRLKSKEIQQELYKKIQNIKNKNSIKYYKDKYNIIVINYNNPDYFIKCNNCNQIFKINKGLLKNRLILNSTLCTKCNSIGFNFKSDSEIKISDFIKENYKEEIITNDRNIINPYELDIYLPDLKLAFEFNGVYWHNELYKSNDYHKIKSDLCDEKKIQLIHIYEDDWIYKQDIVKSMILNKLGKTSNKIYARKTEVKEITDNKLVRNFLAENHIQGFMGSSIKIGLFYKDELVSLMTFGGLRKMMNSVSKEKQFEMLRFCNKLNTNVIGGASKLFKYFIRNYEFKEITTYADRSHSTGKLYEYLGFIYSHTSKPNYYYVVDGIRYHRFGFRKDVLIKEGYDANKSEHQIMLERKIYRIYNSGNLKFKYLKNLK